MRLIIILVLFSFAKEIYAQTFVAESKLAEVPLSGFYKIVMDPSVMKYSKVDFSNLRILDSADRETPFISGAESPVFSSPQFKEYKIIKKAITPNCCSRLILENARRKSINNISILIKNAQVYKQANLLGSDDQITWYALKENFYLNSVENPDATEEIRILNFPLSNYQYLALNINDSSSSPLNILKVGYYEKIEDEVRAPNYLKVPGLSFQVSDSATEKRTYVSIQFDTAQLVDKLELGITGLPFYHRSATLYNKVQVKNAKGKSEWRNSFVQNIDLTSTHASTIILDPGKYQGLILVVDNDDNQPLQFKSIEAYQLSRYLVAWLEKGIRYSLKIGEGDMETPNYDIAYFTDRMPDQPPIIKSSEFKSLKKIDLSSKNPNLFENKLFIWTVILLVAALLVFMSVRMIRDTNSKTQS